MPDERYVIDVLVKVYLSNTDPETAEKKEKKETLNFGRGRRNLLWFKIQWNLVIVRSDITKPSYNKVILLVPALYISLFCTLI